MARKPKPARLPEDLMDLFSILKGVADAARIYGWDVQITVNTGEVESISLTGSRTFNQQRNDHEIP